MVAQGGRAQAHGPGHLLDARRGGLQQVARVVQALGQQPPGRRRARNRLEAPQEGPFAHAGPGRQRLDGVLARQIRAHLVQNGAQPRRLVRDGHRTLNELGLPAVAMRRHDQAARDGVGGLGPEVAADQVQAKVDACGAAGRGQHVALVDIEHVRLDLDGRMTRSEGVGVAPVGRGAATIQQPRRGQHEDA